MSSLLFWIDASNIFSSGDALSTVFVNGLAASDAACHGTVGVPALMVDVPGNQFLRFDASDQEYLELPDTSYNWNWDGTAGFYFTMVALLPDVAGAGYEHVFQFSVNGPCDTSGGAVALYRVASSADGCFELFDTSGVSYLGGTLPGFFANTGDGVAHVYAVAARNSAVTGNAVVDAYVDGGLVASVEGTQPLVANLYTPYGSIGWGGGSAGDVTALGAGVGAYTDMHVYEASAFNGPFSALDAELSSDGLRAKWGASMAGPPQWVHAQASGLPRSAHLGANAVTFALPSYLSDRMVDSYWIASNPFGSASLDPVSNVLTVTGAYTNDPGLNATTYDVVVSASNASGGVSPSPETFTIEQAAGPWFVPSEPFPVAVGGSNAVVADVGGVSVYDTSRLGLSNFYFWISSDPHSNATLVQDAADAAYVDLVVSGSNRGGAAYDVCVSASNELGQATPFPYTARITEKALLGSVTLSNAKPTTFGLSNYFLSGYAQPYHYYLTVPDAYGAAAIVGDVLVLTGAARDVTYAVSVGASNDAGTPLFEDATLTVTETAAIAVPTVWTLGTGVVRSVSVGENVATFGLSNYLYDDAGLGPDFYWVSSDPQSNATIDAQGVLSIAGAYGPAGTYAVQVSASNAAGDVSPLVDSFTVTQATTEWSVVPSVSVSLGTDAYSTSLVGKILDASGLGVADYYWVSADPQSNATLSVGGLLSIQGADRGLAYTVAVSASNAAGELAPLPFAVTVTEKALIGGVTLRNAAPVSYALPDYFLAGLGFDFFYVTADPEASASIAVDGSTLVVTGAYRGMAYTVEVGASNASGVVADVISLAVTEVAVVWTLGTGVRSVTLGENVATFGLSNYLYDDAGLGPDFYWVSSDPQSNATIDANGVLSIAGAYGSFGTYAVEVSASNAAGHVSPLVDAFAVTQASTEWTAQSVAASIGTDAYSTSVVGKVADASGLGVADYYWVSADPQSNATLSAEGLLTIQGSDRGLTYVVAVSASNAVGEVAPVQFAVTVTEKALLGTVTLTDATPVRYSLSNYFLAGLGFDLYYVTADPENSAEIVDETTLVVTGAYRGSEYVVAVGASNAAGLVAEGIALTVTEADPQPTVTADQFYAATVSHGLSLDVDLSQYFSDPLDDALFYWIESDPLSNASIDSSNLSVSWVAIGSTATSFGVVVGASNAAGLSVTGTAVLTDAGTSAPEETAPLGSIVASSNDVIVSVPLTFFDPQDAQLYLWMTSNPYSNASIGSEGDSNTLDVVGDYRGQTYAVGVAASNAFGQMVSDALTVTEPAAAAPTVAQEFASLTLSNATVSYDLSAYYADPQGSALSFWISENPLSNAALSNSTLSVVGAYMSSSNVSYSISVCASNAYGLSNVDVLPIVQAAADPPTTIPFDAVTLSNGVASYALSNYFNSNDSVWVSSDPYGNASISSDNVLSVTGAWVGSNATTYSVVVSASNAFGQTTDNPLAVTEAGTQAPAEVTFGSVVLSNNTSAASYGLASYFTDPQGSNLYYWISANPYGNAAIVGGALRLTGNYRGASNYAVAVSASNAWGQYNTDTLFVTEPADTVTVTAAFPPLTLRTIGATYALSNYFSDFGGDALYYSLGSNPYSNASVSGGSLTIAAGAFRDATYSVTVSASNAFSCSNVSALTITEPAASPPATNSLGRVVLSNVTTPASFLLQSYYFSDPQASPLSFWIASNPYSNATLSGSPATLSVIGSFRAVPDYAVVVAASNAFGKSSVNTLTVAEPNAAAPKQTPEAVVHAYPVSPLVGATTTLMGNAYGNGAYASAQSDGGVAFGAFTHAGATPAFYDGVGLPALGAVTLSTNTVQYGISNYFQDPTASLGLSYWLSGNPKGNATLSAGGVLSVTGFYRGASYSVVACASNASCLMSNALYVTEQGDPVTAVAFGAATLCNATLSYGLSNYFADTMGTPLYYSLGSNPYGNASISVGGVLSITGGTYRHATYSVTVAASNMYGYSNAGTLIVTEPDDLMATPLGSATLSNASVTYGLSNYFSDAAGDKTFYYYMRSNAYSNASVSGGGVLTVAGGTFRNATYSVTVAASNALGHSNTTTLVVTEPSDLTLTAVFSALTLSNATATYGLSNYFGPAGGSAMYYSLSSNPYGNASLSGGTLSVAGNTYRGATYSVTVAASNAYGRSNTDTLVVTEPADLITTTPFSAVTLSNAAATYALPSYFTDTMGSALYYSIKANPYANASLSGSNLSVGYGYRGATYSVIVAASNAFGRSNTDTLTVTEPTDLVSVTAFPAVTMSNNTVVYALSSYFTDAVGSTLYYSLSSNANGNASISSGTLFVTGASRGSTYNVTVAASNAYGYSNTDTLAVTESAPVALFVGSPPIVKVIPAQNALAEGASVTSVAGFTSASPPVYHTTGGGSTGTVPYYTFTAPANNNAFGGQYLQNTSSVTLNCATNGGMTIVTYLKLVTTANYAFPRVFCLTTSAGQYVELQMYNGYYAYADGAASGTAQSASGAATVGTWDVLIWRIVNSTKVMQVFKNGTQIASTTANNVTPNRTVNNMYIARSFNGDPDLNSQFAAVMVYDYAFTDAQVTSMTSAMTGLTGASALTI